MERENIKTGCRLLLGAAIALAGVSHLTFARKEFQAQVPDWVPLKKDDTVVYSGVAEIALGCALMGAPKKYRQTVGHIAATFSQLYFLGILLNILIVVTVSDWIQTTGDW